MRMIVNSPAAVAAAFSSSCSPVLPGESLLRRDSRADHHGGEERRAEELGEQAACQRGERSCDAGERVAALLA